MNRLHRRFESQASFLGLALVAGVLVGGAGALLIWLVGWTRGLVETLIDRGPGPVILLATVPAGLLAASWIASRLAPEVKGSGVAVSIASLAAHAGRIRMRVAPLKILATTLTLGAGGSGGREGPIVLVGASIGSAAGARAGLGEDRLRSLVAAGAGAGIAASFNAPIAGMLFALEVILRSFSVRHLNAVVVASVAAAVTSRTLVGEDLSLRALIGLGLNDARELVLYAALGVVVVGGALLFLRLLDLTARLIPRLPRTHITAPLLFGLGVAAIGMSTLAFTDPSGMPLVLGTGQDFVARLINVDLAPPAALVLGGLALGKILTTSGTLAGRGSAGIFMPSLFIGATLGAGFAQIVAPFWGVSDISSGSFAVVGMAAAFAGVARAPLTAILMVFEITQNYRLVLPLMLATAVAALIADRFHPESVYSMTLRGMGIRPLLRSDVDLLDTVSVGEVMSRASAVVPHGASLEQVEQMLDESRAHGLPVVDDGGQLVGIIAITDLLRHGGAVDHMTAAEAMTPRPVTTSPDSPVSAALERMAALGVGRLPVVDPQNPTLLVGMFRREDAVRAYHAALEETTESELVMSRTRFRQRTDPGTDFREFRIPPGSVADGKLVREVHWPDGCTLVSVRRDRQVLVPTGPTLLRAGDVITAFGTEAARRALVERLSASAEAEHPIEPPPEETTTEMPILEETTIEMPILEENAPDEQG